MNRIARTLVLVLATTLTAVATAQVYKWTDASGKVHYSNQKPPDAPATTVKIERDPTAPAPATAAAGNAAPAAAPPTKPNDEVAQQLAALDQQRCNAAKAVAARYETAPYLQANGPDGQPRKLTVEEEATERLKVKNDVEKLCKGK